MFSNITFKHRLIGVIFLVSLAVIVIPAIFDTPTVDTLSSTESLPVAPTHAALQELDKIEYAFSELTEDLPVQENTSGEPEMVVMPAQDTFMPQTSASDTTSAPELAAAPATITEQPAATPTSEPAPVQNSVATSNTAQAVGPAAIAAAPTTTPTTAPAPATSKVVSIPARGELAAAPAPAPVIAATEKLITDNAWAVQLGAFSKVANAQSLVKELQAKGYTAYIEHMNTTNLTRVLVGTKPDRQQAAALLTELNNTMQIKGIVVQFNPQNAG